MGNRLEGKTALITGGSRGLGRAMAIAFAKEGANVAVVSRKLENCVVVAQEIELIGRKALPLACHVGKWEELEPMVDTVEERLGPIDILVNNAGMSPLYPSLEEVSEELFDKVIAINLKAPFRLMALVGSRMKKAKIRGSIINISSTASEAPSPSSQPYGSAKAGLNALTEAYAHAYGDGVRVNCIMAGPFMTDISKAWDMASFKERASISASGRGGDPEEIVGAALYFASEESSFTTGATLRVDGGWAGDGE